MHRVLRNLALLVVVLIGLGAFAADEDVVQLTNGDRITGRIRELERGRLAISTPAAGKVQIRWGQIATIVSKQRFVVELNSGARY